MRDPQQPPASESLLRRAGHAAAWTFFGNWAGLAGNLASVVVMARLLGPETFGVFGLALVVVAIPEVICSGALNDVLIQRRDLHRGHVNGVTWLSLALAVVFTAGVVALAPQAAALFDAPAVTPVLRVFSVALILSALASIPAALLQRDLRFREITSVDVAGTAAAAAVGIAVALAGGGVWSFVWMELTRRALRLIMFAAYARWMPSFTARWGHVTDLSAYSRWVVGLRVVEQAHQSLSRGLVGYFLGPHALGLINFAFRLQEHARSILVSPLSAVALPVASQTQGDPAMLQRALSGAIGFAALIAYPALIGAAAMAPLAVPFLFGDAWKDAVILVQIALLAGLRAPASAFYSGVLRGAGRPDYAFLLAVVGLVAIVVLVPAAAQAGVVYVALAMAIQQAVDWAVGAILVRRLTGFSLRQQLLAGSGPLLSAMAMGATVLLLSRPLADAMPIPAAMAVLVAIGMSVYVGLLFVVVKDPVGKLRAGLALFRRKAPNSVAA